MEPELTFNVEGDSPKLVFARDGEQLVVRQDDGSPEPLGTGPLHVVWVLTPGHREVPRLRTLYVCDDLGADRVLIDTAYVKGEFFETYPGRPVPWLVMGAEPFRPGEVWARWEVKRDSGWETIGEHRMLLEEWGYVAGDSGFMKGDELRERRGRGGSGA
jgi:hypothetical protein